ncbi:MAG: biotin--[acetyl-CoA-carboxylase] ligase [Oscillospiraceae bacterium]
MATKDEVLELLSGEPGRFYSGQEIAARLQVTRAAVWKAIEALRDSGYPITAVTNRGYALSPEADVFSGPAVAALLPGLPLRIELADSLPSTNTALCGRAAAGEPEGLVLMAREQTGGRGRSGRPFFSPAGTGLYLSVLLRPKLPAPKAQLLTCLAAVAAARAAEEVSGREIRVKWVNDLLCGGKKVCGILTEAAMSLESDGLDYAVLGLGFDLREPEGGWPEGIADIAGGLFEGAVPPGTRTRLAAAFLREFWPLYENFDPARFVPEYRSRQAALGKTVEVLAAGAPPRLARAEALDEECRLVVRYEDGSTQALFGGEVRILL